MKDIVFYEVLVQIFSQLVEEWSGVLRIFRCYFDIVEERRMIYGFNGRVYRILGLIFSIININIVERLQFQSLNII